MRERIARNAQAASAKNIRSYIEGEKIWTDNMTPSVNPAEPTEIVGYGAEAGIPKRSAPSKLPAPHSKNGDARPVEERARLLERVAAHPGAPTFELSAVEVFEVGKAMV